jgi:hypothetical protein
MKLLRFAAIALLATIPMVACDDDDTGGTTVLPPVVIVGTVSGTVSVEGAGLAGVTVNLMGAASQSATTGAGRYLLVRQRALRDVRRAGQRRSR